MATSATADGKVKVINLRVRLNWVRDTKGTHVYVTEETTYQ